MSISELANQLWQAVTENPDIVAILAIGTGIGTGVGVIGGLKAVEFLVKNVPQPHAYVSAVALGIPILVGGLLGLGIACIIADQYYKHKTEEKAKKFLGNFETMILILVNAGYIQDAEDLRTSRELYKIGSITTADFVKQIKSVLKKHTDKVSA